MEFGVCAARRLGRLLRLRDVSRRAPLPAAVVGPRLQLLAVRRLSTRPALCRANLTPGLVRGLHDGPQQEERTPGEGFPELDVSDHTGPKFDIDMLVSLLRQENARDICVIKVPPEMRYTDYFVIGSGTSTRHLHAMAYYIVKMAWPGVHMKGSQCFEELEARLWMPNCPKPLHFPHVNVFYIVTILNIFCVCMFFPCV
uniref:mitochondrial assembly of ribosomal large subunit protein 1 isoform X2 n=1 Tax=Ictidomys tridecemlineatus TaxID=43179 RepID=UPI00038C1FE4|nr:mitochondrial assembly of ribosomal large subunit protein 1 isoform X2 [Ictidomys tridecemlineatus]